jgi:predicted transcriptional regulator
VAERRGPGELEAEVLGALWASSSALTPSDVRDLLPGDLAYTTVLTILRRLHDKGLVVREQPAGSRAYAYAPAVEQAELAAKQMHAFMAAGDDRRAVLARFLGRLSAADRRTLKDLLGGRG